MVEKPAQDMHVVQQLSDLKWLLQQPQFRRWAANLIYGACLVNKTIWDPSARIHMFEGRRSVGIDTLKTFMTFPELYSQFEHERVEAEGLELSRLKEQKSEEE